MAISIPVLQSTIRINEELSSPLDYAYWDPQDQLWRLRSSGVPVVSCGAPCRASNFGETLITKTASEGVDQSEVSELLSSKWGETTITRSPGEGADQSVIEDPQSRCS
jgi:hypothetical protein